MLGEFEIFVFMFFVYREGESESERERETPTLLHVMSAVVKSEHSFQVCMYVYLCVC